MAYRARTNVSHDGIWAHHAGRPSRPPERGVLDVPLDALGPVSNVVECYVENHTFTMRPVDPERDETTED